MVKKSQRKVEASFCIVENHLPDIFKRRIRGLHIDNYFGDRSVTPSRESPLTIDDKAIWPVLPVKGDNLRTAQFVQTATQAQPGPIAPGHLKGFLVHMIEDYLFGIDSGIDKSGGFRSLTMVKKGLFVY